MSWLGFGPAKAERIVMLEIPLKILCAIVCIAAPIILWSWIIVPPLMLIAWWFDRKPNSVIGGK